MSIVAAVVISATLGRVWFLSLLGLLSLVVLYIHAVWLPMKGINGWTGEPKEKYYQLRGWSQEGMTGLGLDRAAQSGDPAPSGKRHQKQQ